MRAMPWLLFTLGICQVKFKSFSNCIRIKARPAHLRERRPELLFCVGSVLKRGGHEAAFLGQKFRKAILS